ncbi:twin-arginine translocation signal domain-containing protein (plasmid) [Halarchaeum sp. CBA1220]|uniref:ABC transporter substrate-binding protein n=1 Tax=Halarchaeum sp. CBA1220 TaxID=1853682 RepID=UPI000F3AA8F3|nr:ABC transporter substrate-binding protein [Halarchaeum sp. CBA1220]QLC34777.1 twin-arginine translocation signal domain-containing protein [Halarchaeum sp. CBA1220]
MPDGSSHDWRSARRQFLKMGGVAGAAALAGCSSETPSEGGDGGTSTTDGSGGSGSGDDSLTIQGRYIPTNMQWNSYAPSHYATVGGRVVFDPFIFYNQKTDEIIPYLFQDWELDGTTLTVSLREGETWHDGEPVTAEDFVTKFTIDQGFGYEISNYIEEATAVDETTLEYTLNEEYREKTIMTVFNGTWMDTPTHRKYGEFAEAFRNASTEEERETVQGDVQNYQPSEPLGCGPFEFGSANQQTLTLTKYEDHPDADNVAFPTYEVNYFASSQQKWADMKNGTSLDVMNGFTPQRIVKTFPDYVRQYEVPRYNGFGLAFNHDDEDFGNRNVRRAVAHAIDQQKMADLADPVKHAVSVPAGVGSFVTGTWKENLGGDVEAYEPYNDTAKAEELLKAEGYTKQGGQWYKPNGEQFTMEIPTPSGWSDIASFTTTVAQMLSDFGIDTTKRGVENTTFFGQYWGPSNFKVAPWFWNNSGKTKPFFTLSWILTSGTVTSTLNYPQEPEAPAFGSPDGEVSPVDIQQKLSTLATTSDQQEVTELTRELAWVVNQNLPMLPLIEKVRPSFWDTREWDIPPVDTDKKFVNWCNYYWPRFGYVTPKN